MLTNCYSGTVQVEILCFHCGRRQGRKVQGPEGQRCKRWPYKNPADIHLAYQERDECSRLESHGTNKDMQGKYTVTLIEGDGIGPEIAQSVKDIYSAANACSDPFTVILDQ